MKGAQNPNEFVLALDFDGVVVDSQAECLVAGHNAFVAHTGQGKRVSRVEDLAPGRAQALRDLRPLVRSGEDYVYLALALTEHEPPRTQAEYDAYKRARADLQATFYDRFYSERRRFCDERRDAWLALNPLFPGMEALLREYPAPERLFVLTTKEVHYVRIILEAREVHLPPGHAHQATDDCPKDALLCGLVDEHGFAKDEVLFVDDHLPTVRAVARTGVQSVLAGWGYNDAAAHKQAAAAGIPVWGRDEFLREARRRAGMPAGPDPLEGGDT